MPKIPFEPSRWNRPFNTRQRLAGALAIPLAVAARAVRSPLVAADDGGGKPPVQSEDLGLPAYNSLITINDNGPANPYGSVCTVNQVKGFVTDVNLILKGFRHDRPSDVGIELSHAGRAVVVMRGVSDGTPIRNANILLNDEAAQYLPAPSDGEPVPDTDPPITRGPLIGGTAYKPLDLGYRTGLDLFGGGAPGASEPGPLQALSTFDGLTAKGDWTLWVRDDVPRNSGLLVGWQLEIITDDPAGAFVVIDNYRARRGHTLRVDTQHGLLARDQGRPASGFIVRLAQRPRGKLKLHADGSFSYTPRGNRRRDTFTYTIQDEFGSSIEGPGRVNITIR